MEIQTQAVEGLCKLLLRGLIGSPKLLSRFIMLWFNPVSDNNSKLAHILGAFLPLYPSLSYDNQVNDIKIVLNIFVVQLDSYKLSLQEKPSLD